MEYELICGALRAKAVTHGAELVSLRDGDGVEYIWGGDPAVWPGRNPVLFPIVGGLKDGRVCFHGAAYEMNRHGFARDNEFTVETRTEDSITLVLRDSPSTRARYPFPFVLKIRHTLTPGGFTTAFTVENPGETPLPFCIGGHTAFRCPLLPGEGFEDYELAFDRPEDTPALLLSPKGTLLPGGEDLLRGRAVLPLDYAPFARLDTLIFGHPRSTGVSLRHRATGKGVRLDFSGFPMVAFWTKPGAPFLCLEPWHGCAAREDEDGEFIHKPHCLVLPSGASKTLSYSIALLPVGV